MKKLKVFLSVVAMSFVMVGCGGGSSDGGETTPPVLNNAELSDGENEQGYFGEEVIFGETKIVGEWRRTGGTTTFDFNFLADGTQIVVGGILDGLAMNYGISKDGTELSSNIGETVYIITKRSGDCYDVEIVTTGGDVLPRVLCKK
ncbi:MAG: hypothetical protein Q9M39_08210 [Sulfurovum sp.]|nr:hypothetical protein [Sulfurovum sp.]